MLSPSSDLLRIDPLTGCKNLLGLIEACMEPAAEGSAEDSFSRLKISPNFLVNAFQYSAVIVVQMNDIRFLNETKGYDYGNSAVRWMAILLQEETNQAVYRFYAHEFAVFLKTDSERELIPLFERILERINREAKRLEFPGTSAYVALILNDQASTCLDSLLMQMFEAVVRVSKSMNARQMISHKIFHGSELKLGATTPRIWSLLGQPDYSGAFRWITREHIIHVKEMANNMDMAQQVAFTDFVSNLPNMRAALLNLEEVLQNARIKDRPFSILLIDGDNLRAVNACFNYAAGDEMIRAMGAVFKQHLRPGDFVARWRTGDEFIVTLQDAVGEGAKIVGERFRLAVKNTSQAWRMPATISIGIASYPANGEDLDALIDKAEAANKRAKQQGKDQVVLAE